MAEPGMEATPDPGVGHGTVRVPRLNVRSGPAIAYPRVGHLDEGAVVKIVGRDDQASWWQIVYSEKNGETVWVSADYIETEIATDSVAIVETAPPPESVTAVTSTSAEFVGKIVFQESSGGRIFTLNADGTGLTHLTNGLDPDWSPDGEQIVFTRWEWDPPGVFVINADGSDEKQIVPGPKSKGPRWSPDGSHIAFTSERTEPAGEFCFELPFGGEMCMELPDEDRWKISVLDLGKEHTMDPATDPFSFAPSWSPDGTRLVYDGVRGLRPADPVEGHDQGASYIDFDHRDMYPVWSPTSDRIAFMFRQHDHWEIYAVNADGSARERLTESPLFEPAQNSVAPEWSPDGQWIAFLTDRGGKWEIWAMRPDGSEEQPLFPPGVLEGIEFQYFEQSEHVLDWWMPPPV
jgi:Tol biopolymer transport system component